ncbi:MAG: glycosyltransferase family 2 protein [Flavobacteriales bacterium]
MNTFVVIVTFNGVKWINKCLGSLRESKISIQTVIIDNGSTDGTLEKIHEYYPEIHLMKTGKNLGFGGANNIGIEWACKQGAEYIFLLNQDAWIEPFTIQKLIEASRKHLDFGVLSPIHLNGKGDALDENFSNFIVPHKCKDLYSDMVLQKYSKNIYGLPFINAAAWLINKKCIDRVGGFNPSFFHYEEDGNYCQRVLYHGMKIGVVPTIKIYHDREERGENIYFVNEKKKFVRALIQDLSNPFKNNSIKIIIKHLLLDLFLNPSIKEMKQMIKKINYLREIKFKKIKTNKTISRKEGSSFLKIEKNR